jgi:hypothetical protein
MTYVEWPHGLPKVELTISWTSTSKSVERSNFFLQLPKIFRRFWAQILISTSVLVSLPLPALESTSFPERDS